MKHWRVLCALIAPLLGSELSGQCEVKSEMGSGVFPLYHRYGFSVALAGDRMAIGSSAGPGGGRVEVLERSVGGWHGIGVLAASDDDEIEEFGYSVALDGDVAVVGTTHSGTLFAKGAVYVFEQQASGDWIEKAKLESPVPDAWALGWAVDVEGDRLIACAKGASVGSGTGWVFVYEKEGGTWTHKASIQPSISNPGDGFGASLDLEGDRFVAGASYNWTLVGEGLAFVFERDSGGTWQEVAVLSSDDLSDLDQFGRSVALHEDRVVVGAPFHSLPTPFAGAVYVFDLLDGLWVKTGKVSTADLPVLADFGWSVDVEGSRLVAGAKLDSDIASGSGAAYLFEEGPGGWNQVAKFYGSGLGVGDTFGYSLDMEGMEVLIGAPNAVTSTASPGYAFLHRLDPLMDPSLMSDADGISLSQGGLQTLQLGACLDHGGDLYFLAGSAAGMSPGFDFSGLAVPLNPDAYFLHTVNHPGAAPLSGAFGVLDAFGRADATFEVAPGSAPSLAGLMLHHAYVVLDPASFQPTAVSGAVAVGLVP